MASLSRHKISQVIRVLAIFLLLLVAGSLTAIALFVYFTPQKYQAVVISGDPVLIVLQKPKGQKPVIFSLPADTYIEGVYGYGAYSLSALWKLGALDTRGGMLLADSLSATLGLPIGGYAAVSGQLQDPLEATRRLFTWTELIRVVTGRLKTNMRLPDFMSLVKQMSYARTSEITVIDLGKTTLFEKVTLPDGSNVSEVDPERIDPIMGDALENEDIRGEAKRVAVVNTTDVTGLGSSIAKVLSHVGAVVISVTNTSEPIERCVVESSKAMSESLTAAYIQSIYTCQLKIAEDTNTADIRMLVGTEYAKRFSQ